MPDRRTDIAYNYPRSYTPSGDGPKDDAVGRLSALLGAHEVRDQHKIMDYLRTGGENLNPRDLAWCASTVNATLAQSGMKGTGSAVATSYMNWGQPVQGGGVQRNDVVVFPHGHKAGETGGHVGIATGNVRNGMVEIISGNHGNRVARTWEPMSGAMIRRGDAVAPAASVAAQNPAQSQSPAFRRDYLGAPGGPDIQNSYTPRGAAPAPVQMGAGHNAIMARGGSGMPGQPDVERYIADAARQRGIDPNIATQVYRSEGATGYRGDRGSSFGPYQLHYGGIAGGGMRGKGLGDEFTRVTGLDARNPATWQKQVDFSLDRAKHDGWGAWHGWKGDPRAGLNGPAPVATPPARPEDLRNPNLEKNMGGSQIASNAPLPPQRPASTLLDHLNPVSSANAAPMREGANPPRIDPADPLRSASAAPVQAPAATPAQLAQPQLNPLGAGSSYQDAAARMRGTGFNGYGPGITEQNDIRTAFGDNARRGDMLPETPYAVNMAGSQQYLQNVPPPAPVQQLPPIDVGRVPQGPGNGYQPATPGYAPMTNDPSQYQPIQTPLSTPAVDPAAMPAPVPVDLPSTDPGSTFTPTDTSPAMGDSMPSVGGEGGGGGMGDMLSGLADALGNLGGGGEGGGGQQMPNPTSGGADALQATASMPDFPHLGDQYAALLQQRGALADAPVGMPQAPGFSLKQIGQAGQQPDQSMEGFARPALKRLFTA